MNSGSLPLFLTLLSAAFFGSWHCAAMCGPVAVALGRRGPLWPYHLGRALSYTLAGGIAGAFGAQLFTSQTLAWKILAAFVLGAVFLLNILPEKIKSPLRHRLRRRFRHWPGMNAFYLKLVRLNPGPFTMGALSVFLPCGWLWTFMAAAAATGSAYGGALVMNILWASSLPALSLMQIYFRKSLGAASPTLRKWVPWGLSLAGFYAIANHFLLHS